MTQTESSNPTRDAGGLERQAWQRWMPLVFVVVLFSSGALFVLRANRWHLTVPTFMLILCWGAMVALGYHLVRMASLAGEQRDLEAPVTGSRDELEREKKKLVKGIKEVEFDRECGKMSDEDATALIATYRTRALEILRDLERLDVDRAGSPRARVEADLRARMELEQKVAAAGKAAKARAKKEKQAATSEKKAAAGAETESSEAKGEKGEKGEKAEKGEVDA